MVALVAVSRYTPQLGWTPTLEWLAGVDVSRVWGHQEPVAPVTPPVPNPIWTDPCPHFAEPGPFCRQCGAKMGG